MPQHVAWSIPFGEVLGSAASRMIRSCGRVGSDHPVGCERVVQPIDLPRPLIHSMLDILRTSDNGYTGIGCPIAVAFDAEVNTI